MSLIIVLYRLILLYFGLFTIFRFVPFFAVPPADYEEYNIFGHFVGTAVFLGVLTVMWLLPRVFLRFSTKELDSLNLKADEKVTYRQIAELAIFLMGLFFFLDGINQLKDIFVMSSTFFAEWGQAATQSSIHLDYNGAKLIAIALFTALSFAVMYYHHRVARFFFRG